MSADVLGALRTFTAAGLAGSTPVYVGELPDRGDTREVAKAVVIQPAGGAPFARHLGIRRQRVDAFCYGPTQADAEDLERELYDVWRALSMQTQGTTVLHWIEPGGGSTYLRDPDTDWPVYITSWTIQSAQQAAA